VLFFGVTGGGWGGCALLVFCFISIGFGFCVPSLVVGGGLFFFLESFSAGGFFWCVRGLGAV